MILYYWEKKTEFSKTNGEYLYLKFNCYSKVTVESTKMSGSKLTIIIVIVIAVVGIIILSIYLNYYRKKKSSRNDE